MTIPAAESAVAIPAASKSTWLSLLAETSLHPGSGRELGVVDLPVAREGGTGYPLLFGSQLKGSLRDRAERCGLSKESQERVFGAPEVGAGNLLLSDARVVLLPIRSLTSSYRWVTCPHVLERLARDLKRTGSKISFAPVVVGAARAALSGQPAIGQRLFLEEREVTVEGDLPQDLVTALGTLLATSPAAARVADQLTIVHNDAFAWFARYGLPIRARNQLDDKKISKNLWYVESLPPDTLLVATVSSRDSSDPKSDLATIFGKDPYLQVGGHETVGEGWVAVSWEAP